MNTEYYRQIQPFFGSYVGIKGNAGSDEGARATYIKSFISDLTIARKNINTFNQAENKI